MSDAADTRFAFNEEQQQLRSFLSELFQERSSQEHVRAAMATDDGFDRALWKQLGSELGVIGLTFPEKWGGAGGGHVELGILAEEAGRYLACVPFLSTVVLAGSVLTLSGDLVVQGQYLPEIATGSKTAALALTDDSVNRVTAQCDPEGRWTLDGTKVFVVDGHTADLLVVAASDESGGTVLFTVDAVASNVTRTRMKALDLTRPLARVGFDRTPARLLVDATSGADVLEAALDRARILLAVEQIGGADACLRMSVDYAKIREQFDRPIGSFQAIKHRCADMFVELELGRSVTYDALWSIDDQAGADLTMAASMAKSLASEVYIFLATENIQIHGGIGFSWEHAAHLYFRRARHTAVMLGDAAHHRQVIATRLGV